MNVYFPTAGPNRHPKPRERIRGTINRNPHVRSATRDTRGDLTLNVGTAAKEINLEINLWTRLPQASGFCAWGLVEIHFCPFCGEAVEVCRVK